MKVLALMLLMSLLMSPVLQTTPTPAATVRIKVQLPGDSAPTSGVTIGMLPPPNPLSSLSLPETDEALLAYFQSPQAVQPVTLATRNVVTAGEARRKLASAGTAILEVGGGVSQPLVTKQTLPEYSDEARRSRVQGTVDMVAVVRDDGTIAAAELTGSVGYGLDEKALAAIKQWQFTPARKDGKATFAYISISISFTLPGLSRSSITNPEGIATFTEVPPGRYIIRGSREGLIGVAMVTIPPSGGPDIVVALKPASTISGRVTDSKGNPVVNARIAVGVLATERDRRMFFAGNQAMTDTRGEYRIVSVAAGDHYLRLQTSLANQPVVYYPGTAVWDESSALTVRSGQEVTGIDLIAPW